MAKTKTVHTSAVSNGKSCTIHFSGAEIAEFGRVDATSGWIKWKVSLGKDMPKLFEHMGWELPGVATTQESFEKKLTGGNFILTAKDKLVEMEVDIAYQTAKSFTCFRFELKGRKKKGFRRELRFTMSFEQPDAAARLESYMQTVGSVGSLKLIYYPEQVQTEIDLSSDEAQQAVLTDE